jgi:hypothetical protein
MGVLIQIVEGQPARWLELGSVRQSNTVKGSHRNMFIRDSMVAIAIRYHRG